MLTEQAKQQRFEGIRLDAIKGIFDEHQKTSYKLQGWLKNKIRGVTSASTTTKAAMGANLGLSFVLGSIEKLPVIGGVVAAVRGGAVAAAQSKDLYSRACKTDDPDDKVKLTGEFMVVSGAQAVSDAVRKVNDAAADLKKKRVTNCKEYIEFAHALYYYNYRLQRLMAYNGQLKMWASSVEAKLLEAQKQWEAAEKAFEREGVKWWDDWTFHKQHCTDGNCTFPWDSLEISGPIPGSVKLPQGLTQDPRFKLTPIKPK